MTTNKTFVYEMEVRDYECDMQGIVNNAVYQNYFEHARHKLLLDCGQDFAEHTQNGLHLVVVRAEIDYRAPLASGDTFRVVSYIDQKSRLKMRFNQHIERMSDGKLTTKAVVIATGVQDGRPYIPQFLWDALL
tara:strand:- start:3429 stop:3827 length:399 start_codon:yes stop_codon:yes gene_type:complete